MAVSVSQNTSRNPMSFANPTEKLLPASQPNNSMDSTAFRNTFTVNMMQGYLQGSDPVYYTDSRLLTMTANDMVFAIRVINNQV